MPILPYQLTEETQPELKIQIYKLVQNLYSDDKIGAADIGDVFTTSGDVLTLNLHETSGLQKTNDMLSIEPKSDGGLQVVGNDGFSVKPANSSINLSADGMKVVHSTGLISGIANMPIGENYVLVEETSVKSTSQILTTFMDFPVTVPQFNNYIGISSIIEGESFIIGIAIACAGVPISWCIINP